MRRRRQIDVKTLKNNISPHEYYLREQGLLRFGSQSKDWVQAGLCPFHEDMREGSFKVNVRSGAFICFSCDTKGGDIISFVQKKYQMSFIEALEKLSNEWRVI